MSAPWSSRWADELSVHPLDDQGVHAFAARADALARSFGALSCEVHGDPTGGVRMSGRLTDVTGGSIFNQKKGEFEQGRFLDTVRRLVG